MKNADQSVSRELLETLDTIQQRVLWLATLIIHYANNLRPSPDQTKVGGHQASSASMVSIMTALYFHFLQAGDRVSVKPHASPVFHAIHYLLGQLPKKYLTMFRSFGGLQAYPSRTKDPTQSIFRPVLWVWERLRRLLVRWRIAMRCPTSVT